MDALSMNNNKVVDLEDDQDVTMKKYVSVNFMAKALNSQDPSKFVVQGDDGNVIPINLNPETIIATHQSLQNSINKLNNAAYITDTGYVKGSDYNDNNKKFVFPIDFVAAKRMKITFASVTMKFTDESNDLTNQSKTLEIHTTTPDGTQTAHGSYPLTPHTSRAITFACSHILEPRSRYNAKLCFNFASRAVLLDIACVKLFYTFL